MKGLRFECTQCGKCCTNRGDYAHVYVGRQEVKDLAAYLGMSLRKFKHKYTFVDEDGWTQLAFGSDQCVFLDAATGACGVYGARPVQCRTFPFWRDFTRNGEWTDEIRSLCEGIGRGRLYSKNNFRVNDS